MIGLHEILARSAGAALARQDPLDGAMPPGRNGAYGDTETPVRNTAHWLVTFVAAHRITGDPRFREAAQSCAGYLTNEELRPSGATFLHRRSDRKDACNGLIGQAWAIEALALACEPLDAPGLAKLAEQVFLLHPFDEDACLWRRVEVDGSDLDFDFTFNHQLWFAAAGSLLAPYACAEVGSRVKAFLSRLPANLSLHANGLVRHMLTPRSFFERAPRYSWRFARDSVIHRSHQQVRAIGYHAFNCCGFSILAERHREYPIFASRKFSRLWSHALSPDFRESVRDNPLAWPYNPTGLEMARGLECFGSPASRAKQADWIAEQLARHYDFEANAMTLDTPDPETLSARLYEAAQLPDLEIPIDPRSR